jgi:hypothetical protein
MSTSLDGDTGVWTFANRSNSFVTSGSVFHAAPSSGTFTATTGQIESKGLFTYQLADQLISDGLLPPDYQLIVDKGVGSGDTHLDTSADPVQSAFWVTAEQIISLADLAASAAPASAVHEAQRGFAACGAKIGAITGPDAAGAAIACLQEPVGQLLSRAVEHMAASPLRSKLASGLDIAKKWLGKALILVDYAATAWENTTSRGLRITMRTLPLPPPPSPGGLADSRDSQTTAPSSLEPKTAKPSS